MKEKIVTILHILLIILIILPVLFILLFDKIVTYEVDVENYVIENWYDEYRGGKPISLIHPHNEIELEYYDLVIIWETTTGNNTKGPYELNFHASTVHKNNVNDVVDIIVKDIDIYSTKEGRDSLEIDNIEFFNEPDDNRGYDIYIGKKQIFDFNHSENEEVTLTAKSITNLRDGTSVEETIDVKFLPIKTKRVDSVLPSV